MRLHTVLLTSSILAGLASAPAMAQTATPDAAAAAQAPAPQADTASNDDIVVTDIRESLRSAISVKRNANAVVDVITSEAIGKFPDRNVAESLSHIPGVSIDRRLGEGEKVAILGTDPALNRMLLDGHALASADWGGNDNDPSSRTFNYSLLAPELVERLEVYKSPEPRIEEGSLGGTVIVRTRRPLDTPANSIFASGGYSYNDRSGKGNFRGSGLYSWKNKDDTFGVLIAGGYDKQTITRAGVEFFGYQSGADFFQKNADGTVNGYSSFWASVRQITLVIGVLACLTYFFFSVEHKGVVGKVARVGIWFLMITFGAAFGFTVMGRIALLAARFEFLFDDWLWLIDPMNQRSAAVAVSCLF